MALHAIIILASFFCMEFVAWFAHKYVMHGFLWNLHHDHHDHSNKTAFEKNDSFSLIFAIPSWLCMMFGVIDGWDYKFYIGTGILLYGIAYVFVHEIIIHQRIKWFTKSNNWYIRGIKRAHKIHHKHIDRFHGECFGMLFVPIKYFKNEDSKKGELKIKRSV